MGASLSVMLNRPSRPAGCPPSPYRALLRLKERRRTKCGHPSLTITPNTPTHTHYHPLFSASSAPSATSAYNPPHALPSVFFSVCSVPSVVMLFIFLNMHHTLCAHKAAPPRALSQISNNFFYPRPHNNFHASQCPLTDRPRAHKPVRGRGM